MAKKKIVKAKAKVTKEAKAPVEQVQENLFTEVEAPSVEVETKVEDVTDVAALAESLDLDTEQLELTLTDKEVEKEAEPKEEESFVDKVEDVIEDAVKQVSTFFRRMKPTVDVEAEKKQRLAASIKPVTRLSERPVITGNAGLLRFPTDRWGITKDLKKSYLSAASRVAGDAAKLQLVKDTLEILNAHLDAKFEADAAYKAKIAAKLREAE